MFFGDAFPDLDCWSHSFRFVTVSELLIEDLV